MNMLQLKNWSERQQVLAVILLAGLLIFLLYYFLLYPQTQERKDLEDGIEQARSRLARDNFLRSKESLEAEKYWELKQNKILREEWNDATKRLAAFRHPDGLGGVYVGKIDYKVRLLDVRHRLVAKSQQLGISLPYDLDMKLDVSSKQDVRHLILKLRAVEKLADLALDLKVAKLQRITPQEPIEHTMPDGEVFLEEYPVHIEFYGSLTNLYTMFRSMFEQEHVFTVRHLRVEAEFPSKPELLSIKAEISALAFLTPPDDLDLPKTVKRKSKAPMGH